MPSFLMSCGFRADYAAACRLLAEHTGARPGPAQAQAELVGGGPRGASAPGAGQAALGRGADAAGPAGTGEESAASALAGPCAAAAEAGEGALAWSEGRVPNRGAVLYYSAGMVRGRVRGAMPLLAGCNVPCPGVRQGGAQAAMRF